MKEWRGPRVKEGGSREGRRIFGGALGVNGQLPKMTWSNIIGGEGRREKGIGAWLGSILLV
jgi:hypothetical protein